MASISSSRIPYQASHCLGSFAFGWWQGTYCKCTEAQQDHRTSPHGTNHILEDYLQNISWTHTELRSMKKPIQQEAPEPPNAFLWYWSPSTTQSDRLMSDQMQVIGNVVDKSMHRYTTMQFLRRLVVTMETNNTKIGITPQYHLIINSILMANFDKSAAWFPQYYGMGVGSVVPIYVWRICSEWSSTSDVCLGMESTNFNHRFNQHGTARVLTKEKQVRRKWRLLWKGNHLS